MLECMSCHKLFYSRFKLIDHVKNNNECYFNYTDKIHIKELNNKNYIIKCMHCGINMSCYSFNWIHEQICNESFNNNDIKKNKYFLRKIFTSCNDIKTSCNDIKIHQT